MLGLFAILACYGVAVLAVHAYYRRSRRARGKASHVVLVTKNNQSSIEWYLRSLFFFSKMRGRAISTTVLDEGSTDDTLHIVRKLAVQHPVWIGEYRDELAVDDRVREHEQEGCIVVRLHQHGQEDMTKMLQMQQ
jgi:hypothetical protein